jgi:hypothetical protein
LIDLRIAVGDRGGIRGATGITATRALSLGQQRIDARRKLWRDLVTHVI